MLQLVYGRAGTGKTRRLMDSLCAQARQGKKVMLLVPEQVSFESERAVYRLLGAQAAQNVEVLSFTRLANLVFRRFGGGAGRRLDEPTRLLLMSAALDEVSGQLKLYADSARDSSFLQMLTQTVAQFKFAGLTPQKLDDLTGLLPGDETSDLPDKLRELSLIYGAFQALVERQYSDPLDDLARAEELAAENGFFLGWNLYLDGFMSFTGAELALLQVAAEDCDNVTAAFSGLPEQADDETSMFYSSLKSGAALAAASAQAGVDVANRWCCGRRCALRRPACAGPRSCWPAGTRRQTSAAALCWRGSASLTTRWNAPRPRSPSWCAGRACATGTSRSSAATWSATARPLKRCSAATASRCFWTG